MQEKGKSIKDREVYNARNAVMCNKSERVPSVLILTSNILALQVNRRLVILMKFIRSGVKRRILIGSLSGPNFAIRTAKMDRSQ